MGQQTAVQWAINEMASKWHYIESGEVLLCNIMDKAMAMEKQQIIDAATWGALHESGERYYNETYGK